MELVQSMSRVGNCHDNACIESFFGRMKSEIGRTDGMTFAEAEALIADYVDHYNDERCQRRLGGITPFAYAQKLEMQAAWRNCLSTRRAHFIQDETPAIYPFTEPVRSVVFPGFSMDFGRVIAEM